MLIPALPKYNRLVIRWLFLVLVTCLAACERSSVPAPTGKVYRIAYSNIVETKSKAKEDDVLQGVLVANAAAPHLGNGDRLEIVYPEQDGSPDQASLVISNFKEQDNASAVILGSVSKVVLEIKDQIELLRMPTLAVIATHPDITVDTHYISQLSYDDERQGQTAALFVRDELFINRAAVVFDGTDPHSSYLAQEFRTKFEQTGGQIDGFELISDLGDPLLKHFKATETPFLYMPLRADKTLDLVARMRSIDWQPVLMGADGLLANLLQTFPNREIELDGMYVTELYTGSYSQASMPDFVQRILRQFGKEAEKHPSTDFALGVEAYRTIRGAMDACPNRTNRACVNKEIRSGKPREGVISSYSIQANGKAKRPIYINKIQNGLLEMVVKVN